MVSGTSAWNGRFRLKPAARKRATRVEKLRQGCPRKVDYEKSPIENGPQKTASSIITLAFQSRWTTIAAVHVHWKTDRVTLFEPESKKSGSARGPASADFEAVDVLPQKRTQEEAIDGLTNGDSGAEKGSSGRNTLRPSFCTLPAGFTAKGGRSSRQRAVERKRQRGGHSIDLRRLVMQTDRRASARCLKGASFLTRAATPTTRS